MKVRMKIVADENILFAEEAFSHFGDTELYPGREISNELLKNADVLITRSVTNVNEELLRNTNIKFVGTATIGWDHIDTKYLRKNNIAFSSAAGCNSDAVAEYVFTAIFHLASLYKISLKHKKLGIIGVGNIGSRVARIASGLGLSVKLNDPPLARKTGSEIYRALTELMDCDILTMHVPLNLEGEDRTYHLLNYENLSGMKDSAIIINSSRGPVIDNSDLLKLIREKNFLTVLDVWENEPSISKPLLESVEIGTPHIAGYSVEGKVNGTMMIYNALARFAGYDPGWKYIPEALSEKILAAVPKGSFEEKINSVIRQVYSIDQDTAQLRKALLMNDPDVPAYFDQLRKKYPIRKEFFNFRFSDDPEISHGLEALRFVQEE